MSIDQEQEILNYIYEAINLKAQQCYDSAKDKLEKAFDLSDKTGNILGKIISLNRLGDVLAGMKNFNEALDRLKKAEILCRKHNNYIELVFNLNLTGMILNETGNSSKAVGILHEAVAKQQQIIDLTESEQDKINHQKTLFDLHINLGFTHRRLCEFVKSRNHYDQAKEIFVILADEFMRAVWCNNFGELLDVLGERDKALKLHYEALKIFQKENHKKAEVTTLNSIASILCDQGDYSQAIDILQDSSEVHRDHQDLTGIITNFKTKGDIYFSQGDYETAIEKYQQALSVSQNYEFDYESATLLSEIGLTYESLAENEQTADVRIAYYAKAVNFYEKAEQKFKKMKNPLGLISILCNKAVISLKQNQIHTALREYETALKLSRQIGSKHNEAIILNNLGQASYREKKFDIAQQYISRSIDLFQQMHDIIGLIVAEANLGKILWAVAESINDPKIKESKLKCAKKYFEQSSFKIEKVRSNVFKIQEYKNLYFEKHFDIYESLVEVCIALKNYAEAFYYFEKSKARTLIDMLTEAKIDISKHLSVELRMKKKELESRISSKSKELNSIYIQSEEIDLNEVQAIQKSLEQDEQALNELEIKIKIQNPEYASIESPDIITIDKLQKQISQDMVFLEYFIGRYYTYVWLITKGDFKFYRLKSSKATIELVEQYYNFLSEGLPFSQEHFQKGLQLFKYLFHNEDDLFILSDANEIQNIFIVPDKNLYKLPFEALITEFHNDSPHYLIDKSFYTRYMPSSTVFAWLKKNYDTDIPPQAPLSLLAFGDPIYPHDDIDYDSNNKNDSKVNGYNKFHESLIQKKYVLARIPNTSSEIKNIEKIFKKKKGNRENLKIFLRRDANEECLKHLNQSEFLKNFRYLHFACHGIIGFDVPWLKQPALILSQHPDQVEDGFLKLRDIFDLRLNASLVVLSACKTALGKEYKGEGLVSLTSGFMFAGARSIISSLWAVADEETSQFMRRLYLNIIAADNKPITALIETKKKFNKKNIHPFYWAPFVLVGI